MRQILLLIFCFVGAAAFAGEASLPVSTVETIREVPIQLKDVTVNDSCDIADYFTNQRHENPAAADIRFSHNTLNGNRNVYVFKQWINHIETDNKIEVVVNETLKIERMRGRVRHVNHKKLLVKHRLNEKESIQAVLRYLRKGGKRTMADLIIKNGDHETMLIYRGEELWRGVGIAIDHPKAESEPSWAHEWFLVDQKGNVVPWAEEGIAHGTVQVCDGSQSSTRFCSSRFQRSLTTQAIVKPITTVAAQTMNSKLHGIPLSRSKICGKIYEAQVDAAILGRITPITVAI